MVIIEFVGLALIILVVGIYFEFIKDLIKLITFKFRK